MGKRKKRDNAESEVIGTAEWEPGVADGVFPRTRKFPELTTTEMVRAIYAKVIGGGISSNRSTATSGSNIWSLEDVDKKPTSKRSKSPDKESPGGVWVL